MAHDRNCKIILSRVMSRNMRSFESFHKVEKKNKLASNYINIISDKYFFIYFFKELNPCQAVSVGKILRNSS